MICGTCKQEHNGEKKTCDDCRARNKKWRDDHKEELAVYLRDWKQKNPELVKEYSARRRAKEDSKEYMRDYYLNRRPQRLAYVREMHLKKKYGLTEETYNEMLQAQFGKCAICETTTNGGLRKLAVDHDHDTGEVRKLLCNSCNGGLGSFKDNVVLLQTAILYLKEHGK